MARQRGVLAALHQAGLGADGRRIGGMVRDDNWAVSEWEASAARHRGRVRLSVLRRRSTGGTRKPDRFTEVRLAYQKRNPGSIRPGDRGPALFVPAPAEERWDDDE